MGVGMNHTVRDLRAAKRETMRDLDKLAREVAFKFWGERCIISMRSKCEGAIDPHHVIHRGNKSTRFLKENIVPMCRKHHSELNDLGQERIFKVQFMNKYPERAAMINNAALTLSRAGKEYIEFWSNYLQKEKEKMG